MADLDVNFIVNEGEEVRIGALLGGEVKSAAVGNFGEVLAFLHKECKINVLDVADLVKTSIVSKALGQEIHTCEPTVDFAGYTICDGMPIGDALAVNPVAAFEMLKRTHIDNYEADFTVAYNKLIGING
jgi:hypothetical protein